MREGKREKVLQVWLMVNLSVTNTVTKWTLEKQIKKDKETALNPGVEISLFFGSVFTRNRD